jgi:putative tricarboxylic transport membrane protein
MRRDVRKLRTLGDLLLFVSIFSMLLLAAVDGKAADPSEDYPSRLIEFVVHSAPGSGSDMLGRIISDIIAREKILNKPIVVVNKVGSGGAVAMGYVFERKGNPHVVLHVTSGSFILTTLQEKLPYNIKSFTPIATMAIEGGALVVRSDSPFKTVDDFIAEARKRPKELTMGVTAFLGAESMAGRSVQKARGVQWNFIAFQGPESVIHVLSGNIDSAFLGVPYVFDHVRAGKMRVLLANAPNRFPDLKDVPTIKEKGLGEPCMLYRGIMGPPNMPDYAVKKLETALRKVWDNDRFKKYLRDSNLQPTWASSEEYGKILDKSRDQWEGLLSELNLLKKK